MSKAMNTPNLVNELVSELKAGKPLTNEMIGQRILDLGCTPEHLHDVQRSVLIAVNIKLGNLMPNRTTEDTAARIRTLERENKQLKKELADKDGTP